MTQLHYNPEKQTLFVAEEMDENGEFESTVIRAETATVLIVEDGLLDSYEGDEDEEDYDPDDYPGASQMWDDYNNDGMSDTSKECIQAIPLSEIIDFYIKNNKR